MTTQEKSKKITLSQKEKLLLDKIEQAKNELKSLREKRKMELGELCFKHGLADCDDALLSKLFSSFSKEHPTGTQKNPELLDANH